MGRMLGGARFARLGRGVGGVLPALAIGGLLAAVVAWASTSPPADVTITGTAGDSVGTSVAVGDFNRDGRDDLVLSAPGAGGGGQVMIFLGPVTAPSLTAASANAIYTGEADGDTFGSSVAVGDFNRDGRSDVVVGAPKNDAGQALPANKDTGRAYVFVTPSTGPANTAAASVPQFTGEAFGDRFGASVAAGDVNGDGRADVVVGATDNDAGGDKAGRAYAFVTPATGVASVGAAAATAVFTGTSANDKLGKAVLAPRMNADTRADVVVGSGRDGGAVYVFLSGSTGPASALDGNANARYSAEAAGDDFGESIVATRLNRDAIDDLIVGASNNDAGGTEAGRAYVFITPASGPVNAGAATARSILTGAVAGDNFGGAVGVVDVNGDHVNDVAVGARNNDSLVNAGGRAYAFRSGSAGPATASASTAFAQYGGDFAGGFLGAAVGGADLNNDGIVDIVAGATGDDSGGLSAGRAYAIYDTDLDGLTNVVDPDDDNDGRPDASDKCPTSKPPLRDRSPKDGCNDPYSRIVEPYTSTARGKTVVFAGWAEADTIGVNKVEVALQLKSGSSCRNWTGRKLSSPTSCTKRRYLKAKGTKNWSYTAKRLPKGSWTLFSRATDKKKHVEKRVGTNNKRRYKKR
jgi:hypothetical protein